MKYYSRDEIERIGRAGVRWEDRGASYLCRVLSSFWLYCERDDTAFTPWMQSDGFWESWITLWFSQNTTPDHVFLDVGANVGYYSMWAAAHQCRSVIAFEPNPECAERIRWANEDNGFRINIEEIALSSEHGIANLWVPAGHSGGASIAGPGSAMGTEIEVPIWAYDDIHYESVHPVMMKIDAEGAEPEIWKGMQTQWEVGNTTVVLEYQKDRYDADAFLTDVYDKAEVSIIGFDGWDRPVTKETLLETAGLQMIVLRSKK